MRAVPEDYVLIGFIAWYGDGSVIRSDEIPGGTTLYQKFTQLPMDDLQILNVYQKANNKKYQTLAATRIFATPEGVFGDSEESDEDILKRHPGAFLIAGKQMENVAFMKIHFAAREAMYF